MMFRVNKPKLMGPAVGAAGSLLGGMAGQALMGKQKAPGPDTSIPGVSKATLQEPKKGGGGGLTAAQVDPTGAIDYFKSGFKGASGYFKTGLDLYNASLATSMAQINNAYAQSNATLKPQAQAGIQALNGALQLMGLTPVDPLAGIADQLAAIGAPQALQQKVLNANQIQNPADREAARQDIMKQIGGLKPVVNDPKPTLYDPFKVSGKSPTTTTGKGNWVNPEERKKVAASQAKIDAWEARQPVNDVKRAGAEMVGMNLSTLANEFNQSYGKEYKAPNTQADVQSYLESTPGYQWNMDQNMKAVQRSASAQGKLMSGNTLIALQDRAANVADQTFQQAMGNFMNIAAVGLPANAQTAANQVNYGNAQANLLTSAGSAAAQTYNAIGNQYASAMTNSGQAYLQSAMFNASAQNTALENNRAQAAQAQNQAMASGPGYMNAATNQQGMNYQIFQGQQGGAAFYGGNGIMPIGGQVGSAGNPQASYMTPNGWKF